VGMQSADTEVELRRADECASGTAWRELAVGWVSE
jgi:hypothetical protein